MLDRINQLMGNYQGAKAPTLYDHQVEKCLEKLKGKLCITLISPNVIAFSRELLEMSGHSVETIASSCLANRSFLFEYSLLYAASSCRTTTWRSSKITSPSSASVENYARAKSHLKNTLNNPVS